MTAPGWYPDPAGSGRQRYFDGQQWTGHLESPTPAARYSGPRIALIAIVTVGILVFAGCTALVLATRGDHPNNGGTSSPLFAQDAHMNEPASDGKFTFTVKRLETMRAIGMSTPRGKWIVVTIDVLNTGDQEQAFLVDNQKLIGSNGAAYTADWVAASPINSENTLMLQLGAGFSAEYRSPFDLPASIEPDKIELHDSALSGGVTVQLSQ